MTLETGRNLSGHRRRVNKRCSSSPLGAPTCHGLDSAILGRPSSPHIAFWWCLGASPPAAGERCFETLRGDSWPDENSSKHNRGGVRLESNSGQRKRDREGESLGPGCLRTCRAAPAPQKGVLPCTHISKRNTNWWGDGAMSSLRVFFSCWPPLRGPSF